MAAQLPPPNNLIWNQFFSDHPAACTCKYPFAVLLSDDQYRRQAFEDYIITLYYQYFRERGMLETPADPGGLVELGLPPDASVQEIKARFRALAKKYHPDVGGEHLQMLELIKQYHKLLGK